MKTKAELRKEYRIIRANVACRSEKDAAIFLRVVDFLSKKTYSSVFIYQSFDGEVATDKLISYFERLGKAVFVPQIIDKTMYICNIKNGDFADTCDISIVPLIAFDALNNRLGFGGGYYDRFLANNKTLSVGLAYECQHSVLPTDSHDVRLDALITEMNLYEKQ